MTHATHDHPLATQAQEAFEASARAAAASTEASRKYHLFNRPNIYLGERVRADAWDAARIAAAAYDAMGRFREDAAAFKRATGRDFTPRI